MTTVCTSSWSQSSVDQAIRLAVPQSPELEQLAAERGHVGPQRRRRTAEQSSEADAAVEPPDEIERSRCGVDGGARPAGELRARGGRRVTGSPRRELVLELQPHRQRRAGVENVLG